MSVEKRLPSGIIKLLRDFLLGRSVPETHRYADEMSSRSPPPPDLPNGPNYRLFGKFFFFFVIYVVQRFCACLV